MTANGEVQTREEVTVYVKELDSFVTVMLLEETPAVLPLGKLCEDHGFHKQCVHGKPSRVHTYATSSKSFCLWVFSLLIVAPILAYHSAENKFERFREFLELT